jgi:hypothetical protein
MELYLQFGWGMMEHCRTLCQEFGGSTAILSPRDLDEDQLIRLSSELRQLGGSVLLDPQFYLPRSDHHRLTSHTYWPDDYDTTGFAGDGRQVMMQALVALNRQLETTHLIVPGQRADTVDDLWLESQRGFLEAARDATDQALIMTMCLSAEAVRSNDQISLVMEQAEQMSVSGYYLVAERPGLAYLVDDPQWLANTLDLAAGLRRLGANVIVGYSNHQQLIMACVGVDAIASGTWMNVRSFFPDKFRSTYEDEIRRRTTWYYCPQALSEYTLPYLDIGVRQGLRNELRPDPPTLYASPIFEVPQPSASGWTETDAFRHYLTALRRQVQAATCGSFDETVATHGALLDRAEEILKRFREHGIFSPTRDFRDGIAANRAALIVLERTHGPMLRRGWADLISDAHCE